MENENTNKTELEKLKEANAEMEKELLKAREMQAERQKIEAEKLLGSTAGQPKPVQQLSQEELKKQEALNFWKGTGIDDAINKYNG
jgi:hypothetical protein